VAVLVPLLSLHATWFRRYKGQAADVLNEMGGACLYSTPAQVNGAPGTLSAYAFTQQLASEVSAALTARLKLPSVPPDTTGFLTVQQDNRVQRMLVLPSGHGTDACVVLLFDQALDDAQRAAKRPVAWPDGFAPFPGIPRFTAVCANTRTSFATAEAQGTPEDAVQEAATVLRASGWRETPAATPTFRLFAERNRLCAVFASRDPKTGQTTLGIVQRDASNSRDG